MLLYDKITDSDHLRIYYFLTEYTHFCGGSVDVRDPEREGLGPEPYGPTGQHLLQLEWGGEQRAKGKDAQKCFEGRVSISSSPTPLPVNKKKN